MSEKPPAIQAQDVSVTYRRGDVVVEAVRSVSVDVAVGEFLAIEGPSGSGKSTLLRAMAGLHLPSSGRILVDGIALADCSDTELSALRRRRIGFVHQLFDLLPDLSAAENVRLPLLLDGVCGREADERVGRAMRSLQIDGLASRRPEELSGGEMLRVALARALVIEPAVILADEPTGSLDQGNGRNVLEIFTRLNADRSVALVVVTHDADVAAAAQRRIRLVDGRIV